MKTGLVLFVSASVVAVLAGQTTTAEKPAAESKAPPAKSSSGGKSSSGNRIILDDKPAVKAVPGKSGKGSGAKAADATAAKKEAPAKIEGMEVSRGDKGFLGVEVAEGRFKINFYDAKKKPMKPDAARAALRWDPKYKVGVERVVLTPAGEHALSSERFIRPPYNFKLFITLVTEASGGGEDPVGETHVIDFKQ